MSEGKAISENHTRVGIRQLHSSWERFVPVGEDNLN